MSAAERTRRVVCDVVLDRLQQGAAEILVLLDDESPEGILLGTWLDRALGADRVWRASVLASNVHGLDAVDACTVAVSRAVGGRSVVIAHPANKTALLLGGRPPVADIFPLGDVYASQAAALAGAWTAGDVVSALIARLGLEAVDTVLMRLVDGRADRQTAVEGMEMADALELLALYDAGRIFRLRPRLVPKLGARTIGIDLFD